MIPHPAHAAPEPVLPRLYTVQEVAAILRLHVTTVSERFSGEQGVLILSQKKPGKQRYRTMRIPDYVLDRVMKRWEVR